MLNVIQEIVINVIGSLTFLFLGIIITWLVQRYRTRKVRAIWSPFINNDAWVILGSFLPGKQSGKWKHSHRVSLSDVDTIIEIEKLFWKAKKKIIISPSAQLPRDLLYTKLIVLGGPISNEVTQRVFSMVDVQCQFDVEGQLIRISQSGEEYIPVLSADNRQVLIDYGILIKLSNPFNPESKMMILAGCHGFGTYSAILAANSPRLANEILNRAGRESFAVILKSQIVANKAQFPEIVFCQPISGILN